MDIDDLELTAEQKGYAKTVEEMCGLDDEFFAALMQNNPEGVLYILRTVLRKPDLNFIKEPDIQKTVKDLGKNLSGLIYIVSQSISTTTLRSNERIMALVLIEHNITAVF